jgi:cystathionine beta-lyase/cystathionine gamma-synthase
VLAHTFEDQFRRGLVDQPALTRADLLAPAQVSAGQRIGTARFVGSLQLAHQAVSLGGVDTLIVHAAAMWAGTLDDAGLKAAGIEPNLVRLSIGLEHPDDLIADLIRGLDTI